MVKLLTPHSELEKVLKYYSKFQRMSIRAGIPQSIKDHRYCTTTSEKNRERTILARKMKKKQHRFRRANKNIFRG